MTQLDIFRDSKDPSLYTAILQLWSARYQYRKALRDQYQALYWRTMGWKRVTDRATEQLCLFRRLFHPGYGKDVHYDDHGQVEVRPW